MSRKSPYSVLIISEGRNTEPAYFQKLEEYLNENYSHEYLNGIVITLFPLSPKEIEIEVDLQNQLFTRKKGTLRRVKFPEKVINDDIEDKYLEEPSRWVRYAQKQSINAGYDQVWSVFDFDNRSIPQLKKSFDLAETPIYNGIDKVQIAFSSYSFEYWILLHYELYEPYIAYSECKDEEREPILCGTNTHANDCGGQLCLTGYLFKQDSELGPILKTKESTFPYVKDSIWKACVRASYMIELHNKSDEKIWEMKPVTTMNIMMESLIPDLFKVKWHLSSNEILFGNWKINWAIVDAVLSISICTDGSQTILINSESICIHNLELNHIKVNSRMVISDEGEYTIRTLDLTEISIVPSYISIEFGGVTHFSKF